LRPFVVVDVLCQGIADSDGDDSGRLWPTLCFNTLLYVAINRWWDVCLL